jgi:hypothetical protein
MMRRVKDLVTIINDDVAHGRMPPLEMLAEVNMISTILKAQASAIKMVNTQ